MSKKTMDIIHRLMAIHPDAECELHHTNPFELLVSTVLSAQTTDVAVNKVTPALFAKYPDAKSMAEATESDITPFIKTIGMYKTKSKYLVNLSRQLLERYNGEVPRDIETLQTLSGVGRKTANVVVSNAFSVPAIAVDTHVQRVSNRIGIADSKDVVKTEQQLQRRIDKDHWTIAHHTLIFHGRRICDARKPLCEMCAINDVCKYYKQHHKIKK